MRLSSNDKASGRLAIQPVHDPAIPDVATFLYRYARREAGSSSERPVREDRRSTERRLRWLLTDNPLTTPISEHGLCARDASGAITALLLAFPSVFVAGDQRLVALGSGGFFVEPEARTLGFYLFKQYLGSPRYAFYFSTTCNPNSSVLWRALGATAVPGSDREYVLPLRYDVLLPAFLAGRTSSAAATGMARVLGRCANGVRRLLTPRARGLVVEPCRDWDKLAELSRRHRPVSVITTERSAASLAWRYDPTAPNFPFDIHVVRDPRGNEGWFSLGSITRGRHGEIRGYYLLDVVWPREMMSFRDILAAIVKVATPKADAVYFRPRPGLDQGECSRWLIPWQLDAPRAFAMTRKGDPLLPVSLLDIVPADGDGVF
jgi:hypothetical protein